MHILIVDDRPPNLRLQRFILESEGHTVQEAADGVEALEILNRDKVDVIISDILMPRMDGYRLCQEVRKSERLREMPFIFYTATYTSPGDEKLCMDLGGDKYMQKPATAEMLLAAVQEVTQNGERRARRVTRRMDEHEVMKEYSARLVFKLEEKLSELLIQSTALETAGNAIVITDSKGVILKVNPAFTTLSGYAAEEAIGQTPRILKSGLHDQAFYHDLWLTILDGKTWRGEFVNRRKDGSLYNAEQTITPVRAQGGPITHFIGIVNDVTERRREEQHSLEREALLANAQRIGRMGTWVYDSRSGRLTWSEATCNLFGITPGEFTGTFEQFYSFIIPEDRPQCETARSFISRTNPTSEVEYRIRWPDGEVRWMYERGTIEFDAEGNEIRRLGMVMDITERKKLEQHFLRAQRMESIGTLASGVAHDLNNILAPIMMSVPVLRMEMSAEERERIIATIEMSAERGAQIVKQVLTFGRGLEGEKRPLQVGMLISEMVKIIRATFPKNITVESTVRPGLWTVLGDATQLHQVLLNLCVNARDAMPDGGTLRLRASNFEMDASYSSMLPESKPGPHVLLEVSDNGSGIPPEVLERIFDPFFTTKGVGKGTGLGLSTVHGIVRSHGGFIKVASEPGKGTTFQVWLPAAPEQDAAATTAPPTAPPTGHGEFVLVVDDEPAVAAAVRTVLEPHGYRVLLATDGTEALAAFAQNADSIAVVLTDIMMPHMNGVIFIRALRKMKPGVPVIASTGLGEKAHLTELKAMGIETVLRKPYSADALLHTIHGVLHPPPRKP